MATTKKSRQKKKTPSAGRSSAGVKKQKKNTFLREIVLWIELAVCLILVLSTFGICGVVGNFFASIFFGLFGLLGYIFPVLLFIMLFIGSGRSSKSEKFRLIGSLTGLFLCLEGMLQSLLAGIPVGSVPVIYREAAADHFCGGLVGGLLVKGLTFVIGEFGSYIVFVIGMIICLILLTQKSLLNPIRSGSEKAAHSVQQKQKELTEERRTRSAVRQNQREARRREENRQRRQNAHETYPKVDFSLTDLRSESDAGERLREINRKQVSHMQEIRPVETDKGKEQSPEEKREFSREPEAVQKKDKKSGEFHIHRADTEEVLQEERDARKKKPEPVVSAEELMQEEKETGAKVEEKAKKLTPKEKLLQEQSILSEIARQEAHKEAYEFPSTELLAKGEGGPGGTSDAKLYETAEKLENTLRSFGVNVTVTNASCGPTVTRYELQPELGVKVSRIVSLADDIKLNLAVADIRIEAPIPGKAAVGIEVPNETNSPVHLRELLESPQFKKFDSKLAFAVGKDIAGRPVIADIAKMPHLLIAGATGSGKSVCINTLIMSILYKATPDEVKLIMIDPKVVELSVYNGIPHLLIPVVTDPKKAAGALNWAVAEMTDRYNKFAQYNVRDMKGYNKKIEALDDIEDEQKPVKMPQIVVIVDELADLMMVASSEVEDAICRLAQLARAAGIHLIIATQRPSVNVITGLIKANMPSRVAFAVSSGVDSRTILDMNGAEKLLGKGDMLFYPQGYAKPARLQGSFVSDKEVGAVVEFLTKEKGPAVYDDSIAEKISSGSMAAASGGSSDRDVLFAEAGRFIIEKEKASIGMLQRMFKIGFNRAARIMDQLCEAGVVTGEEGTKARKILMTMEEFEALLEQLN